MIPKNRQRFLNMRCYRRWIVEFGICKNGGDRKTWKWTAKKHTIAAALRVLVS